MKPGSSVRLPRSIRRRAAGRADADDLAVGHGHGAASQHIAAAIDEARGADDGGGNVLSGCRDGRRE